MEEQLKCIITKLDEIKELTLLSAKNVLTLEDAALLTGLSKSYLYRLTCTHSIPYYKPRRQADLFRPQGIGSVDEEAQTAHSRGSGASGNRLYCQKGGRTMKGGKTAVSTTANTIHKGSEKSRHEQAFAELLLLMRTKTALLEQLTNSIKERRSL